MQAHITAYKGRLVLELLATASIPDEVATSLDNPGNIGQVIMNTGKNLGVSDEALELLRKVKRGHDDIGDIDWFRTGDTAAFGWLGGIYRIADPGQVEGSRTYGIFEYVAIPNDVPQGAMQAIDSPSDED